MNADHLILGLAVPYGVPATNNGKVFWPESFARFLRDIQAYSEIDRFPQIWRRHRGPLDDELIGEWYHFRSFHGSGNIPSGLLVLGRFYDSPHGVAWRNEVNKNPLEWGLSIREWDPSGADGSESWIDEVSLLSEFEEPAVPGSQVLTAGSACESLWEMLTASPMPPAPDRPMRKVQGKAIAVVRGRVIREPDYEIPI